MLLERNPSLRPSDIRSTLIATARQIGPPTPDSDFGAGLANVVPALFSESAAHASSAARGIAAVATAGYSGFLVGPPLVGAIAAFTDLRIAVAALSGFALVAAALAAHGR